MRLQLRPGQCLGHARCNANGADVYPMDDEGFVILPSAPEWKDVPDHLADQARRGSMSCPERAILIDETP